MALYYTDRHGKKTRIRGGGKTRRKQLELLAQQDTLEGQQEGLGRSQDTIRQLVADATNPFADITLNPVQAQLGQLASLGDAERATARGYDAQGYDAQGYDAEGYEAARSILPNFRQRANLGEETGLRNEFANLRVGLMADEFQRRASQQALATSLDQAAQAGTGAGGATAIARAALQQSQGAAANIQQQELQNEQLRAQGAQRLGEQNLSQRNLARQADLSQSNLANQAQLQNQQFNAQALNQASQFGAASRNQASQFGAAAQNQAQQYRADAFNQAAQFLAGAQNQTSQFNAAQGNQFAQAQFNAANQLSQFNASAQNQTAQFNTQLDFQNQSQIAQGAQDLQDLGINAALSELESGGYYGTGQAPQAPAQTAPAQPNQGWIPGYNVPQWQPIPQPGQGGFFNPDTNWWSNG